MPDRNHKPGKASATLVASLMVIALSFAPRSIAAQDAEKVAVIYGDGSKVEVSDWNFVYEYKESDTPLDQAYVAGCAAPRWPVWGWDSWGCTPDSKVSKDLHLVKTQSEFNETLQEPLILRQEELQSILFDWKKSAGAYASDGVTLNRNRNGGPHETDGPTIVTTQGTEIHVMGRLEALGSFLSDKAFVYPIRISLTGDVQVQGSSGRFLLDLSWTFAPSSSKELVKEIRFRKY